MKRVWIFVKSYFQSLFQLFFPTFCLGCDAPSSPNSYLICPRCHSELPYASYEDDTSNPVTERLRKFVPIELANSLLLFSSSGNSVQKLIHRMKYKNHPELAVFFGKKMAQEIMQKENYKDVDIVVPVPLSKNRFRKRGYNQAEKLCKGIRKVYPSLPMESQILKRVSFLKSQTKIPDAYLRFLNVSEAFKIQSSFEKKTYQHILLIDDVITSGSTLTHCLELLKNQYPQTKISALTLAIATNL